MAKSYVLTIFGQDGYNKELNTVIECASGNLTGASIASNTIYLFESEMSKLEISLKIKELDLMYALMDYDPDYVQLPEQIFKHDSVDHSKKKTVKLSLQEQINVALAKEDYETAAKLRDRMAKN